MWSSLTLACADGIPRSVDRRNFGRILQMDDLRILSRHEREFDVVEGGFAEERCGVLRKPEWLQRQADPARVHFVIGVHVLKRLDGVNAGGEIVQGDDCFTRNRGHIGGRQRRGIVIGVERFVIKAQPDDAATWQNIVDANG